jgi:hypothetical protein
MNVGVRLAAVGLAVVIGAGLIAACTSSGGNGSSAGAGSGGSSSPQGSGSPSSSGLAAPPPCNSISPLAGWVGIYTACDNSSGTFTQLTNNSEWDVLLLQVPSGAVLPHMTVSLPQGSSLADLVEQAEFGNPVGSDYAVVPPGATLSSMSPDSTPVHLDVGVDFTETGENVTAMGLVDVVADKVNPAQSEAEAIVTCADYVRSLPQQINQSQPSSPEFWNNFSSAAECHSAFSSASDALDSGESTILEDAADATGDFFDDILPKLVSLVSEMIFH